MKFKESIKIGFFLINAEKHKRVISDKISATI